LALVCVLRGLLMALAPLIRRHAATGS
jgi:uncharacterized protein YjeT (DUF2065 family)